MSGGHTDRVNGGAGRNRTDDLYNAIVALSQLSYGPMETGADLAMHSGQCQPVYAQR